MKIILDGGSFKKLCIYGTFSAEPLVSHLRLKISNIKIDEKTSAQIQRQFEHQNSLIYMTTNLTYKFNCAVDDIQYFDCWIESVDYHETCVNDLNQYITLILRTRLPSLEK